MTSQFLADLMEFIWSDDIAGLVMPSGWLDGGCVALALAMREWTGGQLAAVRRGKHGDRIIEHVVLALTHPPGAPGPEPVYLDGVGVWRAQDLKRAWHIATGEAEADVSIAPITLEELASEQASTGVGVCALADNPAPLLGALHRRFGVFDSFLADLLVEDADNFDAQIALQQRLFCDDEDLEPALTG